jgi:peptidoglycan/xylan/chitin deacetylase (PgdA/CDA1 family)
MLGVFRRVVFLLISFYVIHGGYARAGDGDFRLFYPQVICKEGWDTEIAIINPRSRAVHGTLRGYDDNGMPIPGGVEIVLNANGRWEASAGGLFSDADSIGYVVFESDYAGVIGYEKVYEGGSRRAAIPATMDINGGDIHVPQIASNQAWSTVIGVVNTTPRSTRVVMELSSGETREIDLTARGHRAFTIAELFSGQGPETIHSGVIRNKGGIVAVVLFLSNVGSDGDCLSGVLLNDETSTRLYYPHIARAQESWWTGIVAHNPSPSEGTVTVTPYTEAGNPLPPRVIRVEGGGQLLGTTTDLAFAPESGWCVLDSPTGITGVELFGTLDRERTDAVQAVGKAGNRGVLAKVEKHGWTGIAVVNVEDSPNRVTLTAFDDGGHSIATETISLIPRQKVVSLAEDMFSRDISSANYIGYSSALPVVALQFNGTADGRVLDVLPGLGEDIRSLRAECITTKSAIIRWETETRTNSEVEFGRTPACGMEVLSPESTTSHYCFLGELEQGRDYYYRVKSGSPGGPVHHFRTASRISELGHVMTISFDDGCASDYNTSLVVMKKRSMRGLVSVVTSWIASPWDDFLSVPEMLSLQEAGWEIGSHSASHLRMTQIPTSKAILELTDSKTWLESRGIKTVKVFRYPFDATNAVVDLYSASVYPLRFGGDMNGTTSICFSRIPISGGCICCPGWGMDLNQLKEIVDQAYDENRYVNLNFHEISGDGGHSNTDKFSTTDFQSLLDYIAEKGFMVVPPSELLSSE